jgi:translation initiation factor IF-2
MSDTDGKKPLGLGGAPRSGQVKQSFSHGRTKSVVVEVKRKLTVVPNKGAAPTPGTGAAVATSPRLGDPSKRPAGISDAEMERRMSALRAAKAREADDALKRAEDERAREEERQRKRDACGAKKTAAGNRRGLRLEVVGGSGARSFGDRHGSFRSAQTQAHRYGIGGSF